MFDMNGITYNFQLIAEKNKVSIFPKRKIEVRSCIMPTETNPINKFFQIRREDWQKWHNCSRFNPKALVD